MEDNRRIHVENHSALLEADLLPWLSIEGNLVYDAISGQTPTGAPVQNSNFLAELKDIRRAGYIAGSFALANATLTPQFSYSKESDYKSIGPSLTGSLDLNEKNTTLNFGVAANFDQTIFTPHMSLIDPSLYGSTSAKKSWDYLAGVTQLLSPTTYITFNATLGLESGYLNDPYRGTYFAADPGAGPGGPADLTSELRPRHRNKETEFISINQFITPLNGSAELAFSTYHDSYGIFAQTASLAWYQKIGDHVVVSPSFRFYTQTAASFYYVTVPANYATPGQVSIVSQLNALGVPLALTDLDPAATSGPPKYYSSDYRLSSFNTYTYGLNATWSICKYASFDASYERYEMRGTDGLTPQQAYPSAHVFTVGMRFWLR